MSKFIARQVKKYQEDDGSITLSFSVSADNAMPAKICFEEIKNIDKPLSIEVKQYKSKRSLEQNNLLWALLGKMAEAIRHQRKIATMKWWKNQMQNLSSCKVFQK